MSNSHEYYMRRCLELAAQGLGRVKSNPMVGCVIVFEDNIIGEGYHAIYGGPHAEVNAIQQVKDKQLLSKSTLYVNLEPCNHFGKTPPCSHLIVDMKIPHVVIGQLDPFEKVNGTGVEYLRSMGVSIIHGILENECRLLNKRFNTFQEKKRPYVVLKWAQSQDGYIDPIRENNEQGSIAISGLESRKRVHEWRAQEMGIVVGRKTIEVDNPQLNVRLAAGDHPIRIIIDPDLKSLSNSQAHILDGAIPTLIFHCSDIHSPLFDNVTCIQVERSSLWPQLLASLHEKGITSILVEGGGTTIQHIIDSDIWDEARVFIAPHNISQGIPAPHLSLSPIKIEKIGMDQLLHFNRL